MKITVSILFLELGILVLSTSKDCPPLPFVSLENGVISSGRSKKSYKFTCNYGYYTAGPSEMRCWNGEWLPNGLPRCMKSATDVRCRPKFQPKSSGLYCDPPRTIPNADIWGNQTKVGNSIQYVCHPGYTLFGKGIRTCKESLTWSGITPSCIAEEESLKDLSSRMKKEFINNVGSFSNNRQRSLDANSLSKGLELIILMDRSSSIDPVDFQIGINFIKFLLEEFGVKNGKQGEGTRAAVITFGNDAEVVFNVNTASISDPEKASTALDAVKPNGGGTALQPAFIVASTQVLPRLKMDAKKALFLITDGEPNIARGHETPQDFAKQMKDRLDFEIFCMGIGKEINRDLLMEIASSPPQNHVFMLKKYSDLNQIMVVIKSLPTEKPVPGLSQCGYISQPPSPLSWPWMAAVYIGFPQKHGVSIKLSFCAGILICKQWVLTLASCFYHVDGREVTFSPQEVFVSLGAENLLKRNKWQENFYAIDVIINPEFDPFDNLNHNIALVKLQKEVTLNIVFRPICLPNPDLVIPLHRVLTTNASTAGWGQSPMSEAIKVSKWSALLKNLTVEKMTLSETRECLRAFKNDSTEDTFCAASNSAGCYETLGSPIIGMDPTTNLYQVLGLLPREKDCSHDYNLYGVIGKFVPWIEDVTRGCPQKHMLMN